MMDASNKLLSFRALQLANEQRNAYGMRYNDFTRYRKHCANRTHRLRSSLKMTHGKGRDFKKLPPLTTDNIREGHLQLLLFEAERAWAYAQDLIAESLKPKIESKGTLRHSATGRFRRAVHWATQLLSHCQTLYASSRMSAENLLEVTVYTLILNGRFLRYREEFEDSLVQLSVARSLLDHLASSATTSRDQALAVLFSDEISPEIRYCAHELGRSKAYDIDRIVAEVAPKNQNEIVEGCDALIERLKVEMKANGGEENRRRLKELTWEGEAVPVRNPELVDVLLKVQDAELKLASHKKVSKDSESKQKVASQKENRSKKGVAAYDAILLALSDAEEVGRKLVQAQQASASSSGSMSRGRDVHFVHAYIVFQLLSRRIERDLLLTSALLTTFKDGAPQSTKHTSESKRAHVDGRLYPAVVKLLDTVLQSLTQMRALNIVDENPDLAAAIEARTYFVQAQRCLYLARCYAPLHSYAEALTLIQHGNLHIRETHMALSSAGSDPISARDPSFFPLTGVDVSELENELNADGFNLKKDWFTYNGGSAIADPTTYKKPLFFNIALNYIELDMDRLLARAGKAPSTPAPAAIPVEPASEKKPTKTKVEEVRAPTPEPPAPSRGGLSSLLGGWWGRS